MELRFFVSGTPRPQGSKSAMIRGGRPVMFEVSKHVDKWRRNVRREANVTAIRNGYEPHEDPVAVRLVFVFERPKSHLKASGELRKGARESHTVRPDIDKLSRAVLDAITGVAFKDDSQVITLKATKVYGQAAGVQIQVSTIGSEDDETGPDADSN